MMIWLDENQNIAGRANENFARENMELFTLGYGNYTEDDVREGARCYTGWRYNQNTDAFVEVAQRHDDGTKTVLGHTGNFDGGDLITILTHSEASHRWVSSRVWSRFAKTLATDPGPRQSDQHLRRALEHRRTDDGTLQLAVVSPDQGRVGQAAGRVRRRRAARAEDASRQSDLLGYLQALGQVPFEPPNVGGWPYDDGWLTTAASYTRMKFAHFVAAKR